MRPILILALLCVPVAAADDAAMEAALEDIALADQRLDRSDRYAKNTVTAKDSARQRLMNALERLAKTRGPFRKMFAKREKRRREAEFEQARQTADGAHAAHLQSGSNYLLAEEHYKSVTGSYSDPDKVAYWQARISGTLGADAETEPEAAGQGGGNVTPEQITRETQSLLDFIDQGGVDAAKAGSITAKGERLSQMSDRMIGQFASQDWSAANAAVAKGRRQGADLIARAPAGARPALANRRILLSPAKKAGGPEPRERALSDGNRDIRLGNPGSALRSAEFVLSRDSRNVRALTLKAKALNRMRHFKEAEKSARRALKLSPKDPGALKELAWSLLHQKKYQEAAEVASRLIAIDPENAQAYVLRAFAYEMLGRPDLMMADLRRAARLDPGRYANHLAKARAGERLFDPDRADSYRLLDRIPFSSRPGPSPALIFGLLLIALSAAAAAIPLIKRILAPLGLSMPKLPGFGGSPVRPGRTAGKVARTGADDPFLKEAGLLEKKYRLENVIGRGGYGSVWQAMDVSLERKVAIKQMRADLGELGSQMRKIYLKEAETLAALEHPNIVAIYDVLDRDEGVYLVFEFVSGKTVQQLIAEKKRISWPGAKNILASVCEGLHLAHQKGFIHRDLKPANIMVTGRGYVKIMDFGIARAMTAEEKPVPEGTPTPDRLLTNRTLTVAGTPAYRPPEGLQGIISPATDIYALGICLYEFLTGRTPFGPKGWDPIKSPRPKPASALVPGLGPKVDALLAAALEPDYTRRIPSVREFQRRMDEI